MPKESFKTSPFPGALKNFVLLPSAALVRQPIVEALYGCSSATVRQRLTDGRIPKPICYSDRATVWNVDKLRRVLAGRKVPR